MSVYIVKASECNKMPERRNRLTFEEITALNLRKGDKIQFNFNRYSSALKEGFLVNIRKQRWKTRKTFNGRYWQEGQWKVGYVLEIAEEGQPVFIYDYHPYLLEKIEKEKSDYEQKMLGLISGQTAEELMFNWTTKDLKEFASMLKIKNRSKMTKPQLAMAIEDVI